MTIADILDSGAATAAGCRAQTFAVIDGERSSLRPLTFAPSMQSPAGALNNSAITWRAARGPSSSKETVTVWEPGRNPSLSPSINACPL